MECIACKTPLPEDARFCMTCGLDVTDPAATVRTTRRDPAAELQDRLARTLAGRYEVKKLLGQGGMAAVFLAEELGLQRPVAIKVLPPELSRDEGLVERFEREARTAARLDHPHIIPIHRVESEAGLHYFVMKYVPGRSLDDLLERPEPIPLETTVRILREAASALGHAHARGVVHRDVKPANIMLDQDDRVVLTDFGISKAGESTHLTQTGMIIGTPHYMSPEQALGRELDGRADQYSLGVVAYQMLTRQCPFQGDSAHTIIYKHIHESPRPLAAMRPDVPAHIAEAVATAMAKEPEHRFASMEEFARALTGEAGVLTAARARAGTPAVHVMPTPSRAATVILDGPASTRTTRKSRGAIIGAAAGIAAVALAAVVWLSAGSMGGDAATTGDGAGTSGASTPGAPPASADRGAANGPASNVPSTTGDSSAASRVARRDASPDTPADRAPSAASGDETSPRRNPGRGQGRERSSPPGAGTAAAAQPPRTERAQTAPFTIAAEPYGELYIDGVLIGDTPVVNHPLEVGRTYRVRVVREGYRAWEETITVRDPNPIRRRPPLVPIGGGA